MNPRGKTRNQGDPAKPRAGRTAEEASARFNEIAQQDFQGFTDSKDEFKAFEKFLETYKIDMVQWRNLNFDPLEYFRIIKSHPKPSDMFGVKQIIKSLIKSLISFTLRGNQVGFFFSKSIIRLT